jgi:uncharacterized membrane protein
VVGKKTQLVGYSTSLFMIIIGLSLLLFPDFWYTPKNVLDEQAFTKFAEILYYCLVHKQLGLYIIGFLLLFLGVFTANKIKRTSKKNK